MLWIGITGPMGSGKSTVSAVLRDFGFAVLDADEVVREVLKPGGEGEAEVFNQFGANIRAENGHLDRQALGRVVFNDSQKLDRLERIIHPRVRAEVAKQKAVLQAQGVVAAFYDVPLLFEKQMEKLFDSVWVVTSSEALRLQRLQMRTQLSREEIESRFRNQLPAEYKEARASVVIRNEGSLDELRARVQEILRQFKIPLPTATQA